MDENIAQDLADEQRDISVSEFFEKNSHMLGFDSKARSLVTAVKEALDNSLDVCEDMRILPDVKIEVNKEGDYLEIIVEDNGPGIPEDNIGKVFGSLLFGSRFSSNTQKRGQQGIGISAAVLYSQLTSNQPAKITSKTLEDNQAYQAEVGMDTENNIPIVNEEEYIDWGDKEHGTRIELIMEANLRARSRLIEYLKKTNVSNPHAKIEYDGVKESFTLERATEELPREPEPIKPHPYGIEIGNLEDILNSTDSYSLKGCLTNDFSKVGSKTADNIISTFIDSYYGRELPYSYESIDISESVSSAVSNKKKEDVKLFYKTIEEKLSEYNYVNKTLIKKIVEESAEEVENENNTRIGSTVRDNTFESLYSDIKDGSKLEDIIYNIIDNVTTSRKDDELIEKISNNLADKLKDLDSISKEDLSIMVDSVANDVSEELSKSFGEKAISKVIDGIWSECGSKDKDVPKVKDILDDKAMLKSLHYGMKNTKVSRPSSKCLSPIGEDVLEEGLKNNYDGSFYTTSMRDTGSYSGNPFLVEAGLVYGEDSYNQDSQIQLDRFANRVPLVYQQGACSITQVVKNIGWRNYNLKQSGGTGIPQGPVVLVVHVASTNVPFTSESKDAIAGGESLEHEIEQAVRDVARDLKNHLNEQETIRKKKEKRSAVYDVMPEIAEKFAKVAGIDVPDTGMSVSNITDSIVVKEDKESINIYNNIGSRRKIRIVVEGNFDKDKNNFELEDGDLIWEDVVYSSNNEVLKLDFDYDDIKVEEVSKKNYMFVENKGDNNE